MTGPARRILSAAVIVIMLALAGPVWAGDCRTLGLSVAEVLEVIQKTFQMTPNPKWAKNYKGYPCNSKMWAYKNFKLKPEAKAAGLSWMADLSGESADDIFEIYFKVYAGEINHPLHMRIFKAAVEIVKKLTKQVVGQEDPDNFWNTWKGRVGQEVKWTNKKWSMVRMVGETTSLNDQPVYYVFFALRPWHKVMDGPGLFD